VSRNPGASRHDLRPTSFWQQGNSIGPAYRGKHMGQKAVVLKNLGPIPQEGRICSFLDTLEVRWPDGTTETVKVDVFLK
jgi:hypothetical protein